MGIRIRKAIGWGLSNVQYDKKNYTIQDSRFKNGVTEKIHGYDDWYYNFVPSFCDWIENNTEEALSIYKQIEDEKAYCLDFTILQGIKQIRENNTLPFIYDAEYGSGKIFLVQRLGSTDENRHDDLIDYYESSSTRPKIKKLDKSCGIYPHIGMTRLPNADKSLPATMAPSEFNIATGRWNKKQKAPCAEVAEKLLKSYRPTIPASVILAVKHADIFNNFEETIHELRPMIYTYWS